MTLVTRGGPFAFLLLWAAAALAADVPLYQWRFAAGEVQDARLAAVRGEATASLLGNLAFSKSPAAMTFDGASSRALISADITAIELPTKAISVEAWVSVERLQDWGGIVGAIQDNGSYERGWLLGFRQDKFCFAVSSTGLNKLTYLTSSEAFVPGAWYHVCGTYDGMTLRLFVDGKEMASSTAQSGEIAYPPKTWFEIGAYHDDNELYYMQGKLAEVAVFDRAIVGDTIEQRFQAAKSRFPGVDPVAVKVAAWPTYMHDPERSGATHESLQLPLHEAWRYHARHAPQPAWPPPAKQDFWHNKQDLPARVTFDRAFHIVSDGTRVCFGSSADDQVRCLDLKTGQTKWTYYTEGPIRLAPTIHGGRVYFGSDDGCVYCIDAESGELEWRYRAAGEDRRMPGNGRMISTWPVRTGVLIDGGQARFAAGLFPLQGTYQYALNADTGEELAKGELAFSPQGYMQRRGGNIMVAQGRAPPSKLSVVSKAIKQKIASVSQADDEFALATIRAGKVRFSGDDGQVAAVDDKGEELWRANVEGKAYSLAVAGSSLLVSTDQGVIHRFTTQATPEPVVWDARRDGVAADPKDDPRAECLAKLKDVDQGYGLIIADAPSRLATVIARRTRLKLVCVVADHEQKRLVQQQLDNVGLLGRVSVHHAIGPRFPYVSKLFNLVVAEPLKSDGDEQISATEVRRLLRPGGGQAVALQTSTPSAPNALDGWADQLPKDEVDHDADAAVLVVTRKPLPDAGHWTHIYASPDNTACSGDQHVAGDVQLQWFGEPGPRDLIDRHHRTVPPLYVDGVMFVPGNDRVYGVDAYNGTVLWNTEVSNSRRVAAMRDAGSMAASREYLYVAAGDRCYGLASGTGELALNFPVPAASGKQARDWGFVAYVEDRLFGSSTKPNASRDGHNRRQIDETYYDFVPMVTSDSVFSMDRFSGELMWKYSAQRGAILNPTITIGDGRIYLVESVNEETLAEPTGRSKLSALLKGKASLVAIDMTSGEQVWREAFDLSEIQHQIFLAYSDGKLVLVGTKNKKENLRQFLWYDLNSFDAVNGKHVWSASQNQRLGVNGSHGEQDHHPTIVNGVVYQQPNAYDLHTGKRRENWRFARGGHGCGALSASARAVYFRAGNPTMCNLATGENQKITKVSRPGCWINIIPAGGLLMIPEASSGCTCNFPIQASIVFAPAEP